MPTVLPMTRVEAYLAYKAGVIAESDLKPSLKTNFYSGLENWLAYWCGLTADYPKDENNDPKWYTEEEYYVAYLCGIAPDYPVNCYRRVGAYLRYIISARWDRPEKPLTREEYYLSLMSTTYLPPNDPASVITLDNTAEAPFGDLKIYGDTYQFTTTGKNLFSGAWGQFDNTGGTGTTYGYFKLADASGDYTLSLTAKNDISVPTPIKYLGFTANGGDAQGGFLWAYNGNAPVTKGETAYAYNYREDTKFYCISIYPNTEYTFNWFMDNFDIQLEKGRGVTPYEPYTAGASPNPSYPQDIQVVTGEQTVSVTGKNRLTLSNKSFAPTGFSVEKTSNSLKLTTTAEQGAYQNTNAVFLLSELGLNVGDTITISMDISGSYSGLTGASARVYYNNTSGAWVAAFNSTTATRTLTIPDGATSLVIYFYARQGAVPALGSTALFDNMQIELGSTATAYEQYQGQNYEVNLEGKNLWGGKEKSYVSSASGFTATYNIDGTLNVTGTASSRNWSALTGSTYADGLMVELPAGTYTFTVWGGKETQLVSTALDGTGETANVTVNSGVGSVTFTTSSSRLFYPRIRVEAGATDYTVGFMIEAGSTATAYAPYFTPIELAKIGTYQDYIWKDEDTWKVHKEAGKMIIESADVDIRNTYSNIDYATLPKPLDSFMSGNYDSPIGKIISSCSIPIDVLGGFDNAEYVGKLASQPAQTRFWIGFVKGTTLASMQNALDDQVVYYALATPTDTVITDATLIAQLDALLEGGSYEPQTNITLTAADPNLPGLLQVTVAKYQ